MAKQAEVIARTQSSPLLHSSGSSEMPQRISSKTVEIQSRVDNSNLSLMKSMAKDRGILQIDLETNRTDLINVDLLFDWIADSVLTISNIELMTDYIEIIDELSITAPFRVMGNQMMNDTLVYSMFTLKDTETIEGFSTTQPLVVQWQNIISIEAVLRAVEENLDSVAIETKTISAAELEEKEKEFAKEFTFEGKVKFKINEKGVTVKFIADDKYVLYEGVQDDYDFEIQVLEGEYNIEFSKKGFYTRRIKTQVFKSEISRHVLIFSED